jgi:Tol biopolymer transport system component
MEIPNISSDKFFYAQDGSVIKHIGELPDALRNMHPDVFSFHVNEEKNDFYNWVKDVFDHSRLARNIKNAKTRETMAKKVFIEIFS